MDKITRRTMLAALGGGVAAAALFPFGAQASPDDLITKKIPSSGEQMPVIGMGTWQTFNVGGDPELLKQRTEVLAAFFKGGGRIIDSSPMYGSSQDALGWGLNKLGDPKRLFAADKVWTSDGDETVEQIVESRKEWDIPRFDLMQVHNLVAWQEHLPKLQKLKADNKIRYVGITTSHGRRHGEFEEVMKTQDLDFVQLTYNMIDREVEERLLPLAAERNIAVIANRPFRGGGLVDRYQGKHKLPAWASEIECANWPQFLLKFIVSHPAVTCAIPATTKVEHMRENMGAARGKLPDAKTRKRMLEYVASL
ncbi:aldo/keto reductase [Persicimonas caeni]|uniref:Aldo/keto reductase n=1 Tax=Persicimonas caeni TaxID=2292766 RepID=A0A4Y6PQK6_PERCE|nr:aldo/keto reductase [Persicimonas caeni]QDG50530.1 aldo/keto reductase [Persicimonas caeni]QED31751.1 aldo/keto reductase [Persicimonas caeni]